MEIIIILILILINGIFSMSEIALISARKSRLESAANRGNKGAKTALELQSRPSRLLSTVQIGITLIGLLTGVFSGDKISEDMEAILQQIPFLAKYASTLSVAVVLTIVTFFSLVLGELVPKRIGLTYPETISRMMAFPMKVIATINAPFIWLLTAATNLILKILNIKRSKESRVTEEEIKAFVKEGMEDGEIQAIEQNIVNRVFSVGDRSVSSLMTSRKKMSTIERSSTKDEIRLKVFDHLHNYYPIYDNEKQDIVGVVSLKQLFSEIGHDDFSLHKVMKEPIYIAERDSAYKALEAFKKSHIHYALVIDEYGSTQGIITMSDILEALVGDISDFYSEEYIFQQRDENSWLVDGHYPLPDFLMRFGLEEYVKHYDFNTVGGLIMYELGHIPKQSEIIQWANFKFEILDMDGPAIDKVLVTRIKG